MFKFVMDFLFGKPTFGNSMEETIQSSKAPKCTYCGCTDFYEGPSGGMSTNILCVNPECRHWFNHTPILGSLDDLHRQEPTKEEKEQGRKDMEGTMNIGLPRMRVKLDVLYQEGEALYTSGASARECLQQNTTGNCYDAAHSDLLRLTGYIDAQRRQLDAINAKIYGYDAAHSKQKWENLYK